LFNNVHCVPKTRHTLSFSYLRKILTDFQYSFTGTLCGQFENKVVTCTKYLSTP